MTLVEKIFAKVAGKEKVSLGEVVKIRPSYIMINDGEGHKCVDLINKTKGIVNKDNIIVILDHDIPAGSFDSASNQKKLIDFSKEYDLKFIQSAGIGYQILLDNYVKPGDIIVSCGTHNSIFGAKGALGLHLTVENMATLFMEGSIDMNVPETVNVVLKGSLETGVYSSDFISKMISEVGINGFDGKVIEFTGDAIRYLSLNDKIVLCSMITQTGAVSGFVNEIAKGNYAKTCEYDLAKVTSTVTMPGDLYTTKPAVELNGLTIQAGFIGGCNGGRIEDLRIAADILKGKRVKLGVRLMIGAVSNAVYLQAMKEGLIETFLAFGAQVTNPGCASCKSTSIGVVGDDEILLTTGSHNYPGCVGTKDSKVYIASAAVTANAAITGYVYK